VERRFPGKLEVAVSTDLLCIPEPGFLPVGSRDVVSRKQLLHFCRQ
jgi:hypothetical protein